MWVYRTFKDEKNEPAYPVSGGVVCLSCSKPTQPDEGYWAETRQNIFFVSDFSLPSSAFDQPDIPLQNFNLKHFKLSTVINRL